MVAESIPFYQTVLLADSFQKLGFLRSERNQTQKSKANLTYPLKPIQFTRPAKPYNIIWLASESWRCWYAWWKVMPNTWQFAANAARYTRNYSGGNGTRMGRIQYVLWACRAITGSHLWNPVAAQRLWMFYNNNNTKWAFTLAQNFLILNLINPFSHSPK